MTLDDGDPRRATAVDPREAAAHRRVVRTVERAGPHQERDLREGLGDREVGRVGAGREDLGGHRESLVLALDEDGDARGVPGHRRAPMHLDVQAPLAALGAHAHRGVGVHGETARGAIAPLEARLDGDGGSAAAGVGGAGLGEDHLDRSPALGVGGQGVVPEPRRGEAQRSPVGPAIGADRVDEEPRGHPGNQRAAFRCDVHRRRHGGHPHGRVGADGELAGELDEEGQALIDHPADARRVPVEARHAVGPGAHGVGVAVPAHLGGHRATQAVADLDVDGHRGAWGDDRLPRERARAEALGLLGLGHHQRRPGAGAGGPGIVGGVEGRPDLGGPRSAWRRERHHEGADRVGGRRGGRAAGDGHADGPLGQGAPQVIGRVAEGQDLAPRDRPLREEGEREEAPPGRVDREAEAPRPTPQEGVDDDLLGAVLGDGEGEGRAAVRVGAELRQRAIGPPRGSDREPRARGRPERVGAAHLVEGEHGELRLAGAHLGGAVDAHLQAVHLRVRARGAGQQQEADHRSHRGSPPFTVTARGGTTVLRSSRSATKASTPKPRNSPATS